VRAIALAAALADVPLVAITRAERRMRRNLGFGPFEGDPLPRRRLVRLTIATPRGRLPDPDGPLKSLLDALVGAGLLVDDSLC
jgi:hypothetical protein